MVSYTLVRLIDSLVNIYSMIIVVYCLMSWIPRGASRLIEEIRDVLGMLCEPYLGLFRKIIPPIMMVDFSPIVAILVLQLIEVLARAILL